jgi:hypothetical protein
VFMGTRVKGEMRIMKISPNDSPLNLLQDSTLTLSVRNDGMVA